MNEMIASYDNYSIYKIKNSRAGSYYLCVPVGEINYYKMFLGFSDKELDMLSKDEVIALIKSVNDVIQGLNANAIYALPILPVNELEQAALENDNRKYNDILFNKIRPITSDIYRMLIEANRGTKNMDPIIHVVKRNDFDKKFAGWLAIHPDMRQHISEEDFEKMKENYMNKEEKHEFATIENINGNAFTNVDATFSTEQHTQIDDLEQTKENEFDFSSGITPIKRYDDEPTQNMEKNYAKKRVLKHNNSNMSPGFGSFKFILITLIVTLVVGICVGIFLIK